ncbi:Fat storage-inducing transmembrane protein [Zopfochytrium polystomum]|nr:Fat storage-inducing transmembrane protein [Zopfochytrium polystomum]
MYEIILAITVAVGTWVDLPTSFFANKRNPLNVYFAKFAWGWTTVFLFTFLISVAADRTRSARSARSGLGANPMLWNAAARWLCTTLVWAVLTQYFLGPSLLDRVFAASGTCSIGDFSHPHACRAGGGQWLGFDISGHCFLLVLSSLVLVEEQKVVRVPREPGAPLVITTRTTRLIQRGLNGLLLLWWIMLAATAVYFHSWKEKLTGTILGIGSWYVLYGVAFVWMRIVP